MWKKFKYERKLNAVAKVCISCSQVGYTILIPFFVLEDTEPRTDDNAVGNPRGEGNSLLYPKKIYKKKFNFLEPLC